MRRNEIDDILNEISDMIASAIMSDNEPLLLGRNAETFREIGLENADRLTRMLGGFIAESKSENLDVLAALTTLLHGTLHQAIEHGATDWTGEMHSACVEFEKVLLQIYKEESAKWRKQREKRTSNA